MPVGLEMQFIKAGLGLRLVKLFNLESHRAPLPPTYSIYLSYKPVLLNESFHRS